MGNNRRYSFFQLFTKGNDYRIVIPIIQRDYAQGRDNDKAKEVRGDFLDQLLTYMTAEHGSRDLDFVYGKSGVSTDNAKKKEFIPLDGQQRLTTLFLIHFYLAVRSKGCMESNTFFKTMQVKSGQLTESLFTYRTRLSAVEFCNCLINEENDFSEVFAVDEHHIRTYKKQLSDFIRNSSWFYPDWLQDPTVNGMLRMLDAVDQKFDKCQHQEILRRLISDCDPSVTFIFMDLDDYKLTDDLYIKMNSRGKPLTPFENFKAKYEQYIGTEEKGETVKPDETIDESGKYIYSTENGKTIKRSKLLSQLGIEIADLENPVIKTVKDYFAFNIDTKWSQLFWEYCKGEIKQLEEDIKKEANESDKAASIDRLLSDTLDLKLSRFIKAALASQYAVEHSSGTIAIPEELTGDKPLSFATLENIDALPVEGIVLLTRLFDLYSKKKSIMPAWSKVYYNEEETFKSMITGKDFTFPRRLLQYAYSTFRLKFGDDNVFSLIEWMRFMYNVTMEDNTIQAITRNTYHRAVAAVNKLLDLLSTSPDKSVVRFLASDLAPDVFDFFPDYQYREELLKSILFKRDRECVLHCDGKEGPDFSTPLSESDNWGAIVMKLEAHPYFSGQIGFILKMAGIDDYYAENNNLDWDEDSDVMFKREVIKYGKIASKIFNGGYTGRTMANAALFERAMLAVSPEYLHYNFLNSINRRAGSNNLLRDLSWKCFLRLAPEHGDIYGMVKSLFDILDVEHPEQSLLEIIKKGSSGPQWQKDVVRYEYLMRKSRNGFVAASEDGHMILKDSIQFSKWDHEVYSLVLCWEYMTDKGNTYNISDFTLGYGNSNSWQEIPFVRLSHGNIVVKVKSYVAKDSGELSCHYIRIDADGDRELENFLIDKGFEKNSDTDTVLRRKEPEFRQNESINDYRKSVSDNVKSFIAELSLFLRKRVDEQQ